MTRFLGVVAWYLLITFAFRSGREAQFQARERSLRGERAAALLEPSRVYRVPAFPVGTSREGALMGLKNLRESVEPTLLPLALADYFEGWLQEDPVGALQAAVACRPLREAPGRFQERCMRWGWRFPDRAASTLEELARRPSPEENPFGASIESGMRSRNPLRHG